MSDDFAKFIFIGVMILVVFMANRGAIYEEVESFSAKPLMAYLATNEPPLFILEPPAKNEPGPIAQNTITSTPELAILVTEIGNNAQSALSEPLKTNMAKTPEINAGARQSSFYRYGEEQPPKLQSPIALVGDLITGEVFFKLAERERWPIASITKLVSAAVASRNTPMHEQITLIAADFLLESPINGFKEGDKYSAKDLMAAMLIKSSNEAAEALSRFWGRSGFISGMNLLVNEWGLKETHFDDPTGLSVANQSTAEDLLSIAKNIYERHPQIFNITKEKSAAITELNSGKSIIINNINLLSGAADFIGGKTGYTDEAGGNLLSVFLYKNRPVVTVVLGSSDRFKETELLFNWFKRNYR